MGRAFVIASVFLLVLLTACIQKKEATSEQSIQDIIGTTPEPQPTPTPQPAVQNQTNQTASVPEVTATETMVINKKCKDSAIVYGGCKWVDKNESAFDLKVQSASRGLIPGVWVIITGDSGTVKNEKRPGEILSQGVNIYHFDYKELVKEIGVVTRLEVLPIEVVNGTEYACLNQRIYTIPEAYCKTAEPMKVS